MRLEEVVAEANERRKRRSTPEADEQAALIEWKEVWQARYPALRWLHASLNGVKLTPSQAKAAKRAGMVPGIWDLFLPVPYAGFSGLYIEMKAKGRTLTAEQKQFQKDNPDYAYEVAYTWGQAVHWIATYLGWGTDHPARQGEEKPSENATRSRGAEIPERNAPSDGSQRAGRSVPENKSGARRPGLRGGTRGRGSNARPRTSGGTKSN